MVLVLGLILLVLICKDFWFKNQVSENGKIIVVKFTKKEELPKTTNFYFSYYLNDSLIVTSNSGINYSMLNSENETKIIDSLKLNAYYFAKHISKYPNIIIVNPKARTTNIDLIKKSGFSIEK